MIRTWENGPFKLEIFDTFSNSYGKDRLAYKFYHNGVLIFDENDFGNSPLHAIDSDETVASMLCFISMAPGDTDREYFENYTPEQTEWMENHAEELAMIRFEMEEELSKKGD